MNSKRLLLVGAALCSLFTAVNTTQAQGTKFTYQGRLNDAGAPANGTYDLTFSLFNISVGGVPVAGPLTNSPVAISNGLFTVTLDFGAGVFNGTTYWLQIGTRTNGGGVFTDLTPRQELTPTPYAVYAETAPVADNSVTSAKILDGTIVSADILDGTITSADLGPNSVNTTHIVDGQVFNADLANDAVNSAKILDGSIIGADMANNTVGSDQLADTIALGRSNVIGRLDVFYANTASNQPAITLLGSASQISTYGSDSKEQIRLWGTSYGEILLFDSSTTNHNTVTLSANGTSGGYLNLNQGNSLSPGLRGYGDNLGGGRVLLYNSSNSLSLDLRSQFDSVNPAAWVGLYDNGSERVTFAAQNGTSGRGGLIDVKNDSSLNTIRLIGDSGASRGTIQLYSTNGSTLVGALEGHSGGSWLRTWDENGAATGYFGSSATSGGFINLYRASGGLGLLLDGESSGAGYIAVYGTNGIANIILDGQDSSGNGRVICDVLQINGGSDLSEQFDINASRDPLQPGMVVCIDPQHPGQLMPSSKAYDRTVAGVISGAGGVKTGMLMGQRGTEADGKHPVALTGRVYVQADASNGAIEPGDLLTTSSTPGHAMKVTQHDKAQGAILGKAMSGLSEGKGMVLVLVTLQ